MSKAGTLLRLNDPIMEIARARKMSGPDGPFMQAALAYGDQAGIEWARRVESLILGNWDVRLSSHCYECWQTGLEWCQHPLTAEELTEAHGIPWAAPFGGRGAGGRTRE